MRLRIDGSVRFDLARETATASGKPSRQRRPVTEAFGAVSGEIELAAAFDDEPPPGIAEHVR